jgi:DNA-binding MarR family transcriptional regulator
MGSEEVRLPTPAEEAWKAMFELLRVMQERFKQATKDSGLSPMQLHMLDEIGELGPVPMRQLVSHLGVDPSWITGLVDHLEERGLVERQPSDSDRRVKLVRMTATGEQAYQRWRRVRCTPPLGLSSLSVRDQQEFARIARRAAELQRAEETDKVALAE